MIKKIFMALTITIILAAGLFGIVNTIYAQDDTADTLPEAVYQDSDPVEEALLTRSRKRLRLLQDGECDGECEPQQLRLHQGEGEPGIMRQQRLNLGEGQCEGDCEPQRLREQDGNGAPGAKFQNDCNGDNLQIRQQGGRNR